MLVMPVFNEEACIAGVVLEWREELERTVGDFRMLVLDDGSTDATARELEAFADDPKIEVVHKRNSGHGPTILAGYRRAVREAEWVFQVDSDGEIAARHFGRLWARREAADFVYGVRTGRVQGPTRRVLSMYSRLAVRVLFGPGLRDVNTPYRLMRATALATLLEAIPLETFAPNVAIAGLSVRCGYRIEHVEVAHQGRRTGKGSLPIWRLMAVGTRALAEVVRISMARRPRRH